MRWDVEGMARRGLREILSAYETARALLQDHGVELIDYDGEPLVDPEEVMDGIKSDDGRALTRWGVVSTAIRDLGRGLRYYPNPGRLEAVEPPWGELDADVERIVRLFWDADFTPTDSGCGVDTPGRMEGALPFPHVVLRVVEPADLVAELRRAERLIRQTPWLRGWSAEGQVGGDVATILLSGPGLSPVTPQQTAGLADALARAMSPASTYRRYMGAIVGGPSHEQVIQAIAGVLVSNLNAEQMARAAVWYASAEGQAVTALAPDVTAAINGVVMETWWDQNVERIPGDGGDTDDAV